MTKTKKFIIFLTFLMVFSTILASCGDRNNGNGSGTYVLDLSNERHATPDNLPDNLNLNGTSISVLLRGEENKYEGQGDNELGADPVHIAVYHRNLRVQDRLNMKFDWQSSGDGGLQNTKTFMKNVLAMSVYYDMILTTNNTIVSLGENARLADFRNESQYIDLNQPWWWEDCIKELSFDGYYYNFLVGDMTIGNIMKMSAFYFNKKMLNNMLEIDEFDLYDMVYEHKWTLDMFYYYSRQCYRDTKADPNKVGIRDAGDIFAFPYTGGETINQFVFSTDFEIYERKPTGLIEFKLNNNDRVIEMVSVMRKIIHENQGAWNKPTIDGVSPFDSQNIVEFAEGRYVFLPQRFTASATEALQKMEDDFGILPYPILREGDPYRSYIQSSSSCVSVPYVVIIEKGFPRFYDICAVIEATCADSYRYVTEAFYEIALKNKYARGDHDSEMVEIIYDSAYKLFITEYDSGGISSVFYNAINEDVDVSSKIESVQASATATINEFIRLTRGYYG